MIGTRDDHGRWTPGHSGNPGGRPASQSLNSAIRAKLDEVRDDGQTRAQRIAAILVELAESGDLRAIREVIDRTEGRPPQSIALDTGVPYELKPVVFAQRD